MRKSFMVSEPGTPREPPGFVSQVRWVVRDGAQQRGEGGAVQKAAMVAGVAAPAPARQHKTCLQRGAMGLPRPGSPPHRPNR